ncbi:uncharacterized protein METZ01_LOCUS335852, partial [marine metagenome]
VSRRLERQSLIRNINSVPIQQDISNLPEGGILTKRVLQVSDGNYR